MSREPAPLRLTLVKPTAEGIAVLFGRLTGQAADVEEIRAMLAARTDTTPPPA